MIFVTPDASLEPNQERLEMGAIAFIPSQQFHTKGIRGRRHDFTEYF